MCEKVFRDRREEAPRRLIPRGRKNEDRRIKGERERDVMRKSVNVCVSNVWVGHLGKIGKH